MRVVIPVEEIKEARPAQSPNGTPAVAILRQISDTEQKTYCLVLSGLARGATMHDAAMLTELLARGAIADYPYGYLTICSEYLYAGLPHYSTAAPATPAPAIPAVSTASVAPVAPTAFTMPAVPAALTTSAVPAASASMIEPPAPTIITITDDAVIDALLEKHDDDKSRLHLVYLSIIGALIGFIIGVLWSEMMPPPAPQAEHGAAFPL